MKSDEHYIARCNELALKGLGSVAPNPLVGCVIVLGEKIISEGFHQKFGEAHAEVNAINNLGKDFDFSNCTLYVNLEPCSHHGKTPPCADLIISKKFKKVAVGCLDPNPLVAGKGIEKIKNAGIEVIENVLEYDCKELNKRFFIFQEKKRPYIILKWAQTTDGFISKNNLPKNVEENWISGEESKKLNHQWRAEEQAIMVGTNTVISDDPQLTTRLVEGKNPLRILIDKDLKLNLDYKIFNASAETIVFTTVEKESEKNIKFIAIDFSKNIIPQFLQKLFELNITSVIVEGGAKLLQSFIDTNLWEEARIFVNPNKKFESGIAAPKLNLKTSSDEINTIFIGNDLLFVHRNL